MRYSKILKVTLKLNREIEHRSFKLEMTGYK